MDGWYCCICNLYDVLYTYPIIHLILVTYLGVSIVFTGGLSIFRQYGTRFIGAPIGGWLGDKIKSVSTVVGAIAWQPQLLWLLRLWLCRQELMGRVLIVLDSGSWYSDLHGQRLVCLQFLQNLKIPRKYAGTTSGVVCAIGYCPDLFIFVLYGYWLDKFGNAGYRNIFVYAAVVMVIGVINASSDTDLQKEKISTRSLKYRRKKYLVKLGRYQEGYLWNRDILIL